MPSLKGPTVAGTLAWGGVLLGFLGSLFFAERPGRAEPQASSAGSAAGAASGKAALPPLPAEKDLLEGRCRSKPHKSESPRL